MDLNTLAGSLMFKVGVSIFFAFLGSKIVKKFNLPNVTGYVVVGLILGPSLGLIFKGYGGFISEADTQKLSFISELAVAFIAFSIGTEFTKKSVKKMGKSVFIMTFLESLFSVVLVTVLLYFIPQKNADGTIMTGQKKLAFSLILGAMAASTAPAATLLVMRQYRAHGPVSMRIVGITALDDIFGIIAFGIAIAVGKILLGLTEGMHITLLIFIPIIEIAGSILLGVFFGYALLLLAKKYDKARDDIQILIISAILLTVGLTSMLTDISKGMFSFSPLLINIVMGTIIANLAKRPERTFDALNDVVSTFFVMFFTFAGASLDVSRLKYVGLAGIVFIFARAFGKYLGAFVGAKIARESKAVARYTGFALLPQGGIVIGLLVVLSRVKGFEDLHKAATTIIMASILIYETLGPVAAKFAISKAGEIGGADRFLDYDSNDPDDYQSKKEEKSTKHSIFTKFINGKHIGIYKKKKNNNLAKLKNDEQLKNADNKLELENLDTLHVEAQEFIDKEGLPKETSCEVPSKDKNEK
ncbi:MAG TPA: cation:proton antiporter [Clostridiales bacterium]|nr:cation:proton antiporter [Clostridiales bacterium]